VIPERPEIAGLRPRCPPRLFERFVEVEALHVLALLAGLERSQQLLHLVLAEARERDVKLRGRLELCQQAGQERVVPGPRDLVQREPQEARLFHADIQPGHRHARQPEASRGDEALVAADDGPILASGQDRLDEAELAQAPFECVELVLGDPPRIGRVRTKEVDGDVLNGEGGKRGRCGHARMALRALSFGSRFG